MVAAIKTDTQIAGYQQVAYRMAPAKHAEIDREFVLTEQQYEHFTQCMSQPQAPTAQMLESHRKLQQFIQNSN